MDDPPWDDAPISACAERGLHHSATLHHEFLCEEYADNFIDASFWVVLPLEQIKALDKDLRLSLMAIKVEHNH